MDQEKMQKELDAISLESQAVNTEWRVYLKQQKQIADEPSEAKPQVSYTDTAEFGKKLSQIEQSLQEIARAQKADRQARIDAEKRATRADRKQIWENRIWQTIIVIIGALTLAATIFGILKQ